MSSKKIRYRRKSGHWYEVMRQEKNLGSVSSVNIELYVFTKYDNYSYFYFLLKYMYTYKF
jgi:hypothetical protein